MKKLLIAEDDVSLGEMLVALLEPLPLDVRVVRCGVEALRAVEQQVPDIALIDIGLPQVDGYRVAQEIRRREDRRTFLVAMTGRSTVEDRETSAAAGFDEHWIKPMSGELFFRLIAGRLQPGD